MANVTSTTQTPSGVQVYYDKLLLARARPFQIHNLFSQQRPLPSKNSDTIKFRRYTNLSTATTPLTEGTTPAGQALSVTDLTAQVSQYGDYVTITDKVSFIVEDNVLNESTDLLGQQMGETIDELTRDVLASLASVTNCSGGINGKTPTELSYADIQGVVRTLMGQSAKMFSPMIGGANKFGTAPIRAAYWTMCHTDLLDDLEDIDEFVSVANYPAQSGVLESEWGNVGNTRWCLSPLGQVTLNGDLAGTSDMYDCYIAGRDLYASVMLKEGITENIFKPLGHGDDPLNQRTTMGWKSMYVARILNDNFGVNLRATHS